MGPSCYHFLLGETFINDVDLETAQKAYDALNPHPEKTLVDKILDHDQSEGHAAG